MKPLRVLALAPLLAGLSCAHRAAPPPPVAAVAPVNGWDAGTVTAHGSTHRTGEPSRPWPSGAASVTVTDRGILVPWGASLRSGGSWDIVYRWHGPKPPPKARYAVWVQAGTEALGRGRSGGASGGGGEPRLLRVPVGRDAAGYFLRVRTWPVAGEVTEGTALGRWEGEVTARVKFSPPK